MHQITEVENIEQKELEYEVDHKTNTNSVFKRSNILSKETSKSKSRHADKEKRFRIKQENTAIMKYGSLLLLIAQMVGLVLLMRYSRTIEKKPDDQLYLASTAVFMMESCKFVICIGVVFYQSGCSTTALMKELHNHLWNSPFEVLKLCVPSFLYTIQNNLLYCALSNLDAATYQVCYQLKILTTAIFSAVLLNRKFSTTKWISLILLTLGVIIVQNSGTTDANSASKIASQKQNHLLGLICVLCAACTSGFSGVYFEKILKGAKTSLWIRNIQMGLPSIIIAYATVYLEDGVIVSEKGFFVGYSPIVWTVVGIQAAGGLIVAVVVKYADNVMKVFATSISIVVSCMVSAVVLDFRPTIRFCVGTVFVMTATVLYGRPDRSRKDHILPVTTKREGNKKIITM